MKENRTESITFRISPKSKKWLEELIIASGFTSFSEYLNNQIRLRRRSLIFDKALNESKLTAGKELGLTEKMSKAIDRPEDIKALFDEDKAQKYIKCWLEKLKQNVKNSALDIGMQDIVDSLSTDKGNELLEFFFNYYVNIKEFNSISDEIDSSVINPKKGK